MAVEEAADLARDWIGTPYHHQASSKGAGCDCLGLLRGVWRELYGDEPQEIPPYSMDWDEVEKFEVLHAAAIRHLTPKDPSEVCVGDVILFRMRSGSVAKHIGLFSRSNPSMFIHSYMRHGVVESPLSSPWRRRIVGVFSLPEPDNILT